MALPHPPGQTKAFTLGLIGAILGLAFIAVMASPAFRPIVTGTGVPGSVASSIVGTWCDDPTGQNSLVCYRFDEDGRYTIESKKPVFLNSDTEEPTFWEEHKEQGVFMMNATAIDMRPDCQSRNRNDCYDAYSLPFHFVAQGKAILLTPPLFRENIHLWKRT